MLVSFSENATFGFLFGWLNLRFIAFGRYLVPGHDRTTIVLGVDAVVGGAVSLGLTLVRTGNLPEDMQAFVLSSVVRRDGAMLGSSRLRKLRALDVADELRARFNGLNTEGAAIFEPMSESVRAGRTTDSTNR